MNSPSPSALLVECAEIIQRLMTQTEHLAHRAFPNYEASEQWLAKNEAMIVGRQILAKLENPNADAKQAHPKGRWT